MSQTLHNQELTFIEHLMCPQGAKHYVCYLINFSPCPIMHLLLFSPCTQKEMRLRERKWFAQGQVCFTWGCRLSLTCNVRLTLGANCLPQGSWPSLLWSLKYPRFHSSCLLLEAMTPFRLCKKFYLWGTGEKEKNLIPSNKLSALLEHVTIKSKILIQHHSPVLPTSFVC
jgi:hypothetical protein